MKASSLQNTHSPTDSSPSVGHRAPQPTTESGQTTESAWKCLVFFFSLWWIFQSKNFFALAASRESEVCFFPPYLNSTQKHTKLLPRSLQSPQKCNKIQLHLSKPMRPLCLSPTFIRRDNITRISITVNWEEKIHVSKRYMEHLGNSLVLPKDVAWVNCHQSESPSKNTRLRNLPNNAGHL